MPEQPRYTASDVPALRRELAEWHDSRPGVEFYYRALAVGRQQIRPPGSSVRAARQLAAAEADRLREGDLWYVDDDLCALLAAAHPTMPAFAPRPPDLPSERGFVLFADPIGTYSAEITRKDDVIDRLAKSDPETREIVERFYRDEYQIVAASWGPVHRPTWRAGGVWFSFYAAARSDFEEILGDPEAARRARAATPPITVDNEAVVPWRPDGETSGRYQLPPGDATEVGTFAWARIVFAAFRLASQPNLAETQEQPTQRPERRRTQRAQLPARDVRVVRLRHALTSQRDADPDAAGSGRTWRHRWVVRGHWRRQWYPSRQDHVPAWIAPYLKGPDGAPLIGGEKVTVITAAPPEPSSDSPR